MFIFFYFLNKYYNTFITIYLESENRMINANNISASSNSTDNRTDNRTDSSNAINNIKIIDKNKKNILHNISLNNSTNDSLDNNSIKDQLIAKSEETINNTKTVPVFESTIVQRQGQSVMVGKNYNFSEEIKSISKYFKNKSQDLYQMSNKLKMTDKINELLKRAETEAFIDSNDCEYQRDHKNVMNDRLLDKSHDKPCLDSVLIPLCLCDKSLFLLKY